MEPNDIYERPIDMTKKKTPEQKEKIRIGFWQKWAGTMPADVKRTKGITNDPWTSVTEITPDNSDITNI